MKRAGIASLLGTALLGLTSCTQGHTGSGNASSAPLSERVKVGAYIRLDGKPEMDPAPSEDVLLVENLLGQPFDIIHYFLTWGRPFTDALSERTVENRDLMLSMRPDDDLVWQIANGDQDAYLNEFLRDAADWGGPVYLRWGYEMNGSWMSYSAGFEGGPSADMFIEAWRHISDLINAVEADNVRMVWAPNEIDSPARDGNRLEDYWPGPAHVDVAGFDAYNWGEQRPARGDSRWRTFEEVVEKPYNRVTALTDKPIWLCEFGTTEAGSEDPPWASKENWFRDMFNSRRFPRLKAIIYFSANDQTDVMRDWRLDSSPESLRGFREGWG